MNKAGNNTLWSVITREIGRMRRHGVYIFITLIGPLFAMWLLMEIFSQGVPRDLPVAVVDLDHTSMAAKVSRMVDETSIAKVQEQHPSVWSAKQSMELGNIQAIVVIPKNTEKQILKGEGANLAFYVNNTNSLQGGLLKSGVLKTLKTLSTGIKLTTAKKMGLPEEKAMGSVMPVRLVAHRLFNPFTNYSYFLTAGILPVFLVVFVLMSAIYAIGIELKEGTGKQWLESAGNSITVAVTGKLLPYTLILMVVTMVMNYILFSYLGTPLHGSFGMILIAELLMIVTYQLIAVAILALTANMRLALSFGVAYSMMALTFSGLTFPRIGMPYIADLYAAIFPYSYWLRIFLGQSLRGEPMVNGVGNLYVFFIFITIGFLLMPKLKTVLANEKYWGKE
jgi:ABC-2 type transport system permease protein